MKSTITGYHGTTREQAEHILNGGAKDTPTWSVSDDEYLYLWCPSVLVESGEVDDEEYADEHAIRMAFESAQITAAMSEEPQKEIVVMCFEFPADVIELDDSCENMELARRVGDFDGIENAHVKTYSAKHNSRLDAFVISGLLDNPNLASYRLDEDLVEAAQELREVWIESLHEFDYTED